MLVNPPPNRKRVRRKPPATSAKAPPAALVLTAGDPDIGDDSGSVTLTFDRAIDVSSMDVAAIRVGAITTGNLYQGIDGPIVVDPQTVQVNLERIDTYPESNVKLFADSENGIKAVDDGGTWAGTAGTLLPFP